jgi:hypothetical protein
MALTRGISPPPWLTSALVPFVQQVSRDLTATRVGAWRFESRYFSSLIHFALEVEGLPQAFVAKFPKAQRRRGFTTLPARMPDDVRIAQLEHDALGALAKTWPQGATVFVSPVFFDSNTGMLVFRRLDGIDVYSARLAGELVSSPTPKGLVQILGSVGRELARYHDATAGDGDIDASRIRLRIKNKADALGIAMPHAVDALELNDRTTLVPGIRGFEIRNMMIVNGTIVLFDPGRLRDEPPEADIARMIVSLRMLTWGTRHFLRAVNTTAIEAAFLEGYRENRTINAAWLNLLIFRELAWNWQEGREVLAVRSWPGWFRALLAISYVDFGFRRLWREASSS